MNKKSLIAMVTSLCLVAVIAVGATMAYLSDTTGTLTNTFSVGNVKLTLQEHEVEKEKDGIDYKATKDLIVSGTNAGNNYTGLLPGAMMDKDPFVTIAANSADCYAYMKVTGVDDLQAITVGEVQAFTVSANDGQTLGFSGAWKKIANADGTALKDEDKSLDGIYVYASTEPDRKVIQSAVTATALDPLFTGVGYSKDVTEGYEGSTLPSIILQAAAVQADGYAVGDTPDATAIALFQ